MTEFIRTRLKALGSDPIESDTQMKSLVEAAHDEALTELANHPRNGQIGFCHLVWSTQKRILKEKYGVHWRTPAEMNPLVRYD